MRLDTDTGNAALARASNMAPALNAIAGVGEALTDYQLTARRAQQKLAEAQDAIEESALRGRYDEMTNAAVLAHQQAGDDTARQAVVAKWQEDVQSLPASAKSERARQALTMHLNTTLPDRTQTFVLQGLAIQRKNLWESGGLTVRKAVERGDATAAKGALEVLRAHFPDRQAEIDGQIEGLPTTVRIELLRQAVANNQTAAVEQLSQQIEGLPKSNDQLEYVRRLQDAHARQNKVAIDGTLNEMVYGLEKIRTLPPVERMARAEEMREKLRQTPGVPQETFRVMNDRINAIEKGEDLKSNPLVQAAVHSRINELDLDSPPDEVDGAREELQAQMQAGQLSGPDYVAAMERLESRLERDRANAMRQAVDMAVQRGLVTKDLDDADFARQLQAQANANKWTAVEILEHGAEMAAVYSATPKKGRPVFTAAKIQTTLGVLESGGSTTMYGDVLTFTDRQAAVNYALRELGPRWREVAPEAAAIIDRKWPVAKTLTAEQARALIKEAGGDKNKARELARQRGYNF